MGKASAIFVFLLMINIVGYIFMTGAVEDGLSAENPYIMNNTMLTLLYSPEQVGNDIVYVLNNESALYQNVPTQTPSSFIEEGITFVDRIFIMFGFIKVLLGVLLFPISLLSFLGLPMAFNMLLFTPLTILYIMGLIDILTGGNS